MYANESYLIELLTQAGYLNEEILQYARSQKSPTQDLIDFLIQSNYLTEDVIAQVSASNSLLPVVDLGSMHIPQEVREIISPELARRFRAIPISDDGFSVNVAIDDPLNLETMDSLPQLLAPVVRGDCDFCVGSRFLDKSSAFQSTPLRRVGIQYLSWLIRLFTGTKVTDPTSGFRAANQAVIRDLADYYPADYPEPESIVQIKKMRHRIQEVQVNMFQREGGQSSIRSWKSIYYMIKVSVAVVCASLQKGRKKK